jgi:glycerol kinase
LIDSYFSATKVRWLLDNVPGARAQAEAGELAFGTIDSWLLWKLTGGALHATDVTNASRTMLFNVRDNSWDAELLGLLDVPAALMPQVLPSSALYGHTEASLLGAPIAIGGVAGDQQAALFGQACFEAGDATCTYGDTTSVIAGTGASVVRSDTGLLTTAAWRSPTGTTTYALEATVPTDEALRTTVDAVGAAVAGLPPVTALRLGGAPASDDSLCQLQADRLGRPVERPRVLQTASLGAAFLAGLGSGVWGSPDDLREVWALDRRFAPGG